MTVDQTLLEVELGLSPTEYKVALLVAQGMSNKEVGEKLFVTEKTVKFHLTNVFKKLGFVRRGQLIVRFQDEVAEIRNESARSMSEKKAAKMYRDAQTEIQKALKVFDAAGAQIEQLNVRLREAAEHLKSFEIVLMRQSSPATAKSELPDLPPGRQGLVDFV